MPIFISFIRRFSWQLTLFNFVLIILTGGCQNSKSGGTEKYYIVVKVVDGDTFWIDDGTEKGQKVRLIGVDAPETRRSARKEIGAYGAEAKEFLTAMILSREVRLDYDVDKKDRYGRTLAYAYLRDGTFINAVLIKQGYAMVLTVPPNVRFVDEFVRLQQQARANNRGLWKK